MIPKQKKTKENYSVSLFLSTCLLSVTPIGRILGKTSGQENPDSALCGSHPPGAQGKVEKEVECRGGGRWQTNDAAGNYSVEPSLRMAIYRVGR